MFYLIEFLKITKRNFFNAFLALSMSCALITISFYQPTIEKKLAKASKVKSTHAYFNALIDANAPMSKIERKMKQLPGVLSVFSAGELKATNEIKKIESTFGKDVLPSLAQLNFRKIKIEVAQGLQAKNLQLIQEYLVRLVGKESVTMGSVKFPRLKKGRVLILEILNSYGFYILAGLLGFLWLVGLTYFAKATFKHAFIIENFQRRRNVGITILVSGFGFIWALNLGFLTALTGTVSIAAILWIACLIAVVLSFNIWSTKWKRI